MLDYARCCVFEMVSFVLPSTRATDSDSRAQNASKLHNSDSVEISHIMIQMIKLSDDGILLEYFSSFT